MAGYRYPPGGGGGFCSLFFVLFLPGGQLTVLAYYLTCVCSDAVNAAQLKLELYAGELN